MKLRFFDDGEAIAGSVARVFAHVAKTTSASRDRFAVALSGGPIVRRVLEMLAEPPYRDAIVWSQVEFWWCDEHALPPDHPDSNHHLAHEALFSKLDLSPACIHRMEADRADLDEAAADYEAEIAQVLGTTPDGAPPALDLALLELGSDGQVAGLFPEADALRPTRRWVTSSFVPKLDAWRLSLTPYLLNHAEKVFLLAVGADRAPALAGILEGPREPERWPAQLIHPANGDLYWLVDRAARAALKSGRLRRPC